MATILVMGGVVMSAHFTIKPPHDANWLELLNTYADTPWWKQAVSTIAEMAREESAQPNSLSIYVNIAETATECATYRTADEAPIDYLRELIGEADAREAFFQWQCSSLDPREAQRREFVYFEDSEFARPAMSYVPRVGL